jgi:hypothetical protein
MPHGKAAFVRCVQLSAEGLCRLFGHPDRPPVCASLKPHPEMCKSSGEEAMAALTELELETAPLPRD